MEHDRRVPKGDSLRRNCQDTIRQENAYHRSPCLHCTIASALRFSVDIRLSLQANLHYRSANAVTVDPIYEFLHSGACSVGWQSGGGTTSSVQECADDCASISGVGYFALKLGQDCTCFYESGGCGSPDTTSMSGYWASGHTYRIIRTGTVLT